MSLESAVSPVVVLRSVSKSYREGEVEHRVLEDVSIVIEAGKFVAVLGPSGSGKSTILNLIGGIDVPSTGDVEVVGVAINRLSERDRTLHRRYHIGLVFQFFNLIPTLTVEENLHLPLQLSGGLDAPGRARATGLLERVGLGSRRHSFPDRLSGGEQQRVAIARAVVAGPQVILADEPTGNLDHDTGTEVMELLLELVRDSGSSLLMATHSRELAGQADVVLRIRDSALETVVGVAVNPAGR